MEYSEPTRKLRVDLRRTWLVWSCVPLAGTVVALLATTAVYASQPVLTTKRAEDSFYQFLAISALVFLFTFGVDGKWTSPARLAEKIRKRGERRGEPLTPDERAGIASSAVVGTSSALGLLGHAIGFASIMCLMGGTGRTLAFLLLAVGVAYQLFLFSRHPYYEQVVEAAYRGELEAEEGDKKAKAAKDDNRQP